MSRLGTIVIVIDRKFYGRYRDLIKQYEVSLSQMLNNILQLNLFHWLPNRSDFTPIIWPQYRIRPLSIYEMFQCSICDGCVMPTGTAYPSGCPVPSLFVCVCVCVCVFFFWGGGYVYALIIESISQNLLWFPDFSPRISISPFLDSAF